MFLFDPSFFYLTHATKPMNQTFIFGLPCFFSTEKAEGFLSKHQKFGGLNPWRFSSSASLSSDLQVASPSPGRTFVASARPNGGGNAGGSLPPLGRGRVGIVIVAHDRTDMLARCGFGGQYDLHTPVECWLNFFVYCLIWCSLRLVCSFLFFSFLFSSILFYTILV